MICTHCGVDTDQPMTASNTFLHMELLICAYFGVTPYDLTLKIKKKEFTKSRQCIFYFSRKYLGASVRYLAHRYNFRDHTPVVHNTQVIKNSLQYQDYIFHDIQHLDYEIQKNVLKKGFVKVA